MTMRALFRDAATRLGRQVWGTKLETESGLKDTAVQPFAEEVIATLSSEKPIELFEPIQVVRNHSGPLFDVKDIPTADLPAITVTKPDGSTQAVDPVDVTGPADFDDVDNNQTGGGVPAGDSVTASSDGGGGLAGTIVSGGPGSGPYVVQLESGVSVPVSQLQISNNDAIPTGTSVVVFQRNSGTYFMQVPVWLSAS